MKYSRPLTSVAERLRSNRAYNGKTALFMGSGCAASSGVPSPEGCVKILENEFPQIFQHMRQKTLAGCLGQLSLNDQARMIALFLEGARLNWTHLCVAMLMKEGFLQRVLTTNFDHLLVRACAFLNLFPTVYEPRRLEELDPAQIAEPCIFYLRGQGNEVLLLGSEEEAKRHKERLAPVFTHAGSRLTWLVAGYGGQADPEYTHLAGVSVFEKELYWVGEQKEPPEHVKQDLLRLSKGAYYVSEFTTDDFFLNLTKNLDLFPPAFLTHPFTFLQGLLSEMVPFTTTGQKADEANKVFNTPLAWVEEAITRWETGELPEAAEDGEETERPATPSQIRATAPDKPPPKPIVEGPPDKEVIARVRVMFESQQFRQVIEELASYQRASLGDDTCYLLSRAHMMHGNGMLGAAKKRSRQEAGPLLEEAVDNYRQAVELNPGCYQSLNNWGYALKFQAELHDGPKADRLLKQAIEKYDLALQVKPDCHQVLNNWGHALKMRADRHEGQESENLLKEAISKYQAALALKDDDFTALHNWGNALLAQADRVGGVDGDRLRAEGMKKMKAAQAVMLLRT